MGGNVFKNNYTVVRLEEKEYTKYCDNLSFILKDLGITLFHFTRSVSEKRDHGDLDVIVLDTPTNYSAIRSFFHEYPTSKNGDVFSVLFNSFQIDFIFTPEKYFNYSCNYFDWNDLGNLIGRLSKSLGFKHGHNGLYYIQRIGDHYKKEHILSYNFSDIIKILKLNPVKFKEGFSTYKELFDFIIESPYFDKEKFKLENLNNTNRVRDRKRKTYNLFLKYVEDIDKKPIVILDKYQFVCSFFPTLDLKVKLDCELYYQKIQVNKILDGRFIISLLGIEGKKLGVFKRSFVEKNPIYITTLALSFSQQKIEKDLKDFYKEFIC